MSGGGLHAVFELRGVSVRGVIEDLSLSIGPGITSLVGPNGSGKTTILRLLAGVLRPSKGLVSRPERVGASWQNPYYSFYKPTVLEEVASIAGGGALESLEASGLAHAAHRSPFTLSAGEARILSILLATLWGPDAVVIDEPTSGLGPREWVMVASYIRSLRVPVVMATHDLEFALTVSDRIIGIRGGRVVYDAGPGYDPRGLARALGYPEWAVSAEKLEGAVRCLGGSTR